jgi:hypothetical protein
MYIERNIEVRAFNHCCSGKSVVISYSERVFVAVDMQRAMRMSQAVICGLPGSKEILPHYGTSGTIFEKIHN